MLCLIAKTKIIWIRWRHAHFIFSYWFKQLLIAYFKNHPLFLPAMLDSIIGHNELAIFPNLQRLKSFSINEVKWLTYHRLELATITPLSIEKLSVGKPAIFQARILIGSPRFWLSENSFEHGMFTSYRNENNEKFTFYFCIVIILFCLSILDGYSALFQAASLKSIRSLRISIIYFWIGRNL